MKCLMRPIVPIRVGSRIPSARLALASPARGYAKETTKRNSNEKAKLGFRFALSSVPIELYPMVFILIAGFTGAGFAMYRHLTRDEDLRLYRQGKIDEDHGH